MMRAMSELRLSDASLDQPSKQQHLLEQVAWFNRLRLGAVVGMVCAAFSARTLGLIAEAGPIYVCAGITLALNLIYMSRFQRLSMTTLAWVRMHVGLQIGLDLLILTGVLHFSGGCASPLSFFFLFHSFIAAQMVSVRTGLVVAVASVMLVGALGVMELTGTLTPATGGLLLMDMVEVGVVGLLGFWDKGLVLVEAQEEPGGAR